MPSPIKHADEKKEGDLSADPAFAEVPKKEGISGEYAENLLITN